MVIQEMTLVGHCFGCTTALPLPVYKHLFKKNKKTSM